LHRKMGQVTPQDLQTWVAMRWTWCGAGRGRIGGSSEAIPCCQRWKMCS